MNSPKHIISFDYLRILACFGVVLLHVSAYFWYSFPVHSSDWFISNAYNTCTRISVPLFVMISGALFLDPGKKISLKSLWLNHILRLFVIYLFWMSTYGILYFRNLPASEHTLKKLILSMINGRYHLWFLPMLIGIYVLIPLLRTWISSCTKKDLEYFLLLFVIFQIMVTSIRSFIKTPEVLSLLEHFQWELICSYVGYFVLGHFLYKGMLPDKWNRFLLIGTPFFYLANLLISTLQARATKQAQGEFFDSYGIFTFLLTVSIFQLLTIKTGKKEHSKVYSKLVTEISKSTLGVYLIHLLVIDSGFLFFLNQLPPVLAIPLISLGTFVISLLISTLLRKLPLIGKYIC